MSGCYLDVNFLIYVKNVDAPQHKIATEKLVDFIKSNVEIYISPLVIDEFIHAMLALSKDQNSRQKKIEKLRKSLEDIFNLPFLKIIGTPTDIQSQLKTLDLMTKYNLQPRDSYHLLTMLSNSVDTFATFDKDFKKVFASKLILPI